MKKPSRCGDLSRRQFVHTLAALPVAPQVALRGQPGSTASIPIIDSHIHLFAKRRSDGKSVLPAHYRALARPFGVVGAIVVEASFQLEDNQWVLDQAATD